MKELTCSNFSGKRAFFYLPGNFNNLTEAMGRFKFLTSFLIVVSFLYICGCQGKTSQCTHKESQIPQPELQTVIIKEVPKPENIASWSAPRFTPDGEWISFSFRDLSNPDRQNIGIIHEDGSEFQCLTCSLDVYAGGRPIWFPDGERFIFRCKKIAQLWNLNTPFCVFDTTKPSRYFPIQNITSSDELTHNRYYLLSPDGKKLVWTKVRMDGFRIVMGDLKGDSISGYAVEGVRVLYPPEITDDSNLDQWAWANAWYEAKSFTDGGKTLVFASTRNQGGNIDVYTLDLETSEVRRITRHPEWDEGAEYSPDGNYIVMESTRAQEVLSIIADLPVPPLIDFVLVPPVTNATLTGEWYAPHEPFLIDKFGDRSNYYGQRISNEGDEGWAVRGGVHWHPDGTKVVWGAYMNPTQEDSHIMLAYFPSLSPSKPLRVTTTPTPSWAPLLKDVPLRLSRVHKSFSGEFSGIANLDIEGTILSGKFRMGFENFSDDGENIINGSVEVQVPVIGIAQWVGKLKLSGCHKGFLQMDLNIVEKDVTGFILSEKDGKRNEKRF